MSVRATSCIRLAAILVAIPLAANAEDWSSLERAAETAAQSHAALCPDISERTFTHYRIEGIEDRSARLLTAMTCYRAAYNSGDIWFWTESSDQTNLLSFATPDFTFDYVEGSDSGKVARRVLNGFTAQIIVSNGDYDVATKIFSAGHKWRGLGDATEGGSWTFDSYGRPVLKDYEIDPTYNGEIDPIIVVKDGVPVP